MDQIGKLKLDKSADVEFDKLLGFEHLGETAPEGTETAVGVAFNKRLAIEGPPPRSPKA